MSEDYPELFHHNTYHQHYNESYEYHQYGEDGSETETLWLSAEFSVQVTHSWISDWYLFHVLGYFIEKHVSDSRVNNINYLMRIKLRIFLRDSYISMPSPPNAQRDMSTLAFSSLISVLTLACEGSQSHPK